LKWQRRGAPPAFSLRLLAQIVASLARSCSWSLNPSLPADYILRNANRSLKQGATARVMMPAKHSLLASAAGFGPRPNCFLHFLTKDYGGQTSPAPR
jgi:hypothetical protein